MYKCTKIWGLSQISMPSEILTKRMDSARNMILSLTKFLLPMNFDFLVKKMGGNGNRWAKKTENFDTTKVFKKFIKPQIMLRAESRLFVRRTSDYTCVDKFQIQQKLVSKLVSTKMVKK